MNKIKKNFNLSELTINRIADLVNWLPAKDNTHVVEECIGIVHTQKAKERGTKMFAPNDEVKIKTVEEVANPEELFTLPGGLMIGLSTPDMQRAEAEAQRRGLPLGTIVAEAWVSSVAQEFE